MFESWFYSFWGFEMVFLFGLRLNNKEVFVLFKLEKEVDDWMIG